MLELFIQPKKETIITKDSMQFIVYPIFFSKKGQLYEFRGCNLEKINDIKLNILFSHKIKRHLKINPNIKNGIINAINRYHAKQNIFFDCYAFTNLVLKTEQHNVFYMKKFWKTKPKRFFSSIGDIIFLTNKADNLFYHSAIYIGYGLYVSIYGAGGDLEISSLSDMKYNFRAEQILIARPHSNIKGC